MWHTTTTLATKITDPILLEEEISSLLIKKEEARGFLLLVHHNTKGEWGSVHSPKGCCRKYKFRMLTIALSYRSR